MTELENVLRLANALQPAELPHFLGQIEEAWQIAWLRLTPATPAPAPPGELLNITQAAAKLIYSKDCLHKKNLPLVRRLGRKRMFSRNGIDEFPRRQR